MNLIEIIILALALGIDCMVVSFSQGLIFDENKIKNSFTLAAGMGFFQGIMPLAGYYGINLFSNYIENFSRILVFTIFMVLGIKFIFEAFRPKENIKCLNMKCIITLGIATSIDALAAGINLNLTSTLLLKPALIIGIFSFFMSLCGFWFSVFFKSFPSKIMEISGGLILIILACTSLIN